MSKQELENVAEKANYLDMYKTWKDFGGKDFYNK